MIFMKRYRYNLWTTTAISLLLLFCILLPTVKPIIQQNNVRYIIDAGHGLPDGGAVGLDGTTEQLLNLQIAKKMVLIFPLEQTVMTRTGEQSLSKVQESIREKKISDMKERVGIANRYKNAWWISIHMNTYPNSSVYGCQVFYRSDDDRSKEVAQRLQNAINEQLQPNHTKQIKPIPESLYLFKNTTNSAILIECGFITNPDDLTKLKSDTYQNKLAQLIYTAVAQ